VACKAIHTLHSSFVYLHPSPLHPSPSTQCTVHTARWPTVKTSQKQTNCCSGLGGLVTFNMGIESRYISVMQCNLDAVRVKAEI
jgi:hypothetical protein